MSRRFQFSLKTFLAAVLVVATFFGGMAVQKHLDGHIGVTAVEVEKGTAMGRVYRDGSVRVHFHPGAPTGPMRKSQLSIPAILCLTLVVAAFLSGMLFSVGRNRNSDAITDNLNGMQKPPFQFTIRGMLLIVLGFAAWFSAARIISTPHSPPMFVIAALTLLALVIVVVAFR